MAMSNYAYPPTNRKAMDIWSSPSSFSTGQQSAQRLSSAAGVIGASMRAAADREVAKNYASPSFQPPVGASSSSANGMDIAAGALNAAAQSFQQYQDSRPQTSTPYNTDLGNLGGLGFSSGELGTNFANGFYDPSDTVSKVSEGIASTSVPELDWSKVPKLDLSGAFSTQFSNSLTSSNFGL